MKRYLKVLAIALFGLSLGSRAGTLTATFDNAAGSLLEPVNEIFLWKDEGLNALTVRSLGGAMSGWTTQTLGSVLVLSGTPLTAPGTGTMRLRFNYSGPAASAPAYRFQWAEVFFDGVARHVRAAGTVYYSGTNAGTYAVGPAFTHMNSTDIPGLFEPAAPVPLPASGALLLSTLVFAPIVARRRTRAPAPADAR